MPVAILEERIKIARTALAYLHNILSKYDQQFLLDAFDVAAEQLRIFIRVREKVKFFSALGEISWQMQVERVRFEEEECELLIDLKRS